VAVGYDGDLSLLCENGEALGAAARDVSEGFFFFSLHLTDEVLGAGVLGVGLGSGDGAEDAPVGPLESGGVNREGYKSHVVLEGAWHGDRVGRADGAEARSVVPVLDLSL